MNTPTRTPANTEAPASGGSKTLWAAMLVLVLVLVVVVLAMGATLIRIQSQPIEPRMSVLPQPARVVHASASTPASASPAVLEQNRPPALINKAQVAIENVANQTIEITAKPRPVLPRQPEPAVLRPPGVGVSNTATPESK